MTLPSRSRFSFSRLSLIGAFALFGLATAGAAAGPPAVDNGGSGSTSAETSMMIEQLGLVPTNGGPGSFTMDQTPTLVGSDKDREIVAVGGPTLVGSDEDREIVAVDGPTLVGSGEDREIVASSDAQESAGMLDESARAAGLIALSPAQDTFEIVVVQRGQPY